MPKKQTEWSRAYNEKAYDRMYVTVPKGRKETIEELAKAHGMTVNGYTNELLREAAGLTEEEWKEAPKTEETEWKFVVPADIISEQDLAALKQRKEKAGE